MLTLNYGMTDTPNSTANTLYPCNSKPAEKKKRKRERNAYRKLGKKNKCIWQMTLSRRETVHERSESAATALWLCHFLIIIDRSHYAFRQIWKLISMCATYQTLHTLRDEKKKNYSNWWLCATPNDKVWRVKRAYFAYFRFISHIPVLPKQFPGRLP